MKKKEEKINKHIGKVVHIFQKEKQFDKKLVGVVAMTPFQTEFCSSV